MTSTIAASPRERIVQTALRLLDAGGPEAVSTRAVSAAAAVQPPTIYRHFGDMSGLLDAVASAGFADYLRRKQASAPMGDPVQELRAGWDRNVEFGLTHPHLYTLMYGAPRSGGTPPAALEAAAMLRTLMQRVAASGRLALGVDHAAALIHAASLGVTLSLIRTPVPDRGLADRMREVVLQAVLTPEAGAHPDPAQPEGPPPVTVHAVALAALLPTLATPLSAAERALLLEWLRRLVERP